jgi:hypothetical protein
MSKKVPEQRVHLVIRCGQPTTGQGVLMLDRGRGVFSELAGEQAHSGKHRTDLPGDHRVRVLEPGDDSDVPSKIAHSFRVTHRTQDRDHHPEVPGHRGLQREQANAAPLRFIVHRVHLVTVSDNQFSTRKIGLVQRDRRIDHHLRGQPDHPREVSHQLIELGVERGSHVTHLLCPTCENVTFSLAGAAKSDKPPRHQAQLVSVKFPPGY